MGRGWHRLSALQVSRAKKRGLYADGGNLFLQVGPTGGKSWLFRYERDGRMRSMGLGPVHTVSLGEARDAAREARKLLYDGTDPIAYRDAKRAAKRLAEAKAMSFDECAAAYVSAHAAGWRNAKHAAQWTATLKTYASPVFGQLPVADVDTALVTKALDPIWRTKSETASRLRGRIESVLGWATVRGYRAGDNPARWRGHLDHLLPARAKVQKVAHHAALPFTEIATFVADLRKREGTAARALEFAILTAGRTSEVLGARWDEIDLQARVWIIPGERMKAAREHRVPLSEAALSVLERMQSVREGDLVFPGQRRGKPLSNMVLLMLLRRMDRGDLTAHGFRSTFRDWAAERTPFPGEVAEAALAHTVSSKVEAAYRRGDLFEKRRRLMDAWATFCTTPAPTGASVVPMTKPAAASGG